MTDFPVGRDTVTALASSLYSGDFADRSEIEASTDTKFSTAVFLPSPSVAF